MTQQIAALQLRSCLVFFGAENVVLEIAKGMRHLPYRPIIGVLAYDKDASSKLLELAQQRGIQSVVFNCSTQFDRSVVAQIR